VRDSAGKYGGSLTGGSLLVRESRIVSRLLIELHSSTDIMDIVLADNLFQNNSASTTRRYCRLILTRLLALTHLQLHLIAEGSDNTASIMLFAATLKVHPLVRYFMQDVVFNKIRCYEPSLNKMDWVRFIEQRETIDTEIGELTESSRKKIGQVVYRILAEAGVLSDTRSMIIQFPTVPFDVADSLLQSSDEYIMNFLKLGKAA